VITQTDAAVLVGLVEQAIRQALDPVAARVKTLTADVAALKSQPLPKYAGVYVSGESYVAGSLVTRGGGLWLALSDTGETPGAGSTAWRLVVKEGRARE
jgi:hypothetical protein